MSKATLCSDDAGNELFLQTRKDDFEGEGMKMVAEHEERGNNERINNNSAPPKEENNALNMGGRTLSLITEEDMLLEFEQMQKRMNLVKPGKNLTVRVDCDNSNAKDGRRDSNKDGSDSHRSSSTNGDECDGGEDGGSPNDLENTVHLTDKFLTDRSRSGETTRIRFSEDASSRGTTFAAASQKGLGRKEREDTFSVSIFDAGKLDSMLGKRRGAIVASENQDNRSNNDNNNVRVGNETFRSLGDLKVNEKRRIGMFSVIDGHGGAGAAAHCAASLHEMIFEQLSDKCEQMAEATEKARDKLMKMKRAKVNTSRSSSYEDMSGLSGKMSANEGEEVEIQKREEESGFDELVREAIIAGFKRCDEDFLSRNKNDFSGACVAMALIWDDAVWIAHLGDCKIIAADFYASKPLELLTETLTTDHIASNTSEANAVITRGGFIRAAANTGGNIYARGRETGCNLFNNYFLSACGGGRGKSAAATSTSHISGCTNTENDKNFVCSRGGCDSIARVNGELAVTRSIGDRRCKPHISCEPDVRKTRFKRKEKRDDEIFFRSSNSSHQNIKGKESFLLLSTDGTFGCGRVKDRDAAEVAANALLIESHKQHSPKASSSSWGQRARRACAEVISHVKKKGGKDDATVILIDIESAFSN